MWPRRKNSNPNNNVFGKNDGQQLLSELPQTVHDFFHARTGAQGCFLAGIIRFCYASLYLYSILLMALQMRTLFDPRKGLMPYSITGQNVGDYDYSIFEFAPESSLLVYAMFLLGVSSGVLLLLGIEPRKGAMGAFFVLHNLQSHNTIMFDDHEFHMNKMWAFFLVFLPLDHFTIHDDFGGIVPIVKRYLNLPRTTSTQARLQKLRNTNLSTSWAMWPFRLWQLYTCMIYMGAGLSKLNASPWIQGNALSWFWYNETIGRFYPAFVIELFYNRLITIKLQTWLCLLIENICVVTIWPKRTRKITFAAVVLMHLGMEFALVMHIFEYLSVLGWMCFFVYPNDAEEGLIKNNKKKNDGAKWTTATFFDWKRAKTIETAVVVSLLYLLTYDIFPIEEVQELMPAPLAYLVGGLVYPLGLGLDPIVHLLGIHANPYILDDDEGSLEQIQSRMTAVIRFNDGREPILHQDAEWASSSFVKRETNYWYDTYMYYLMEEVASPDDIPYYGVLSVHLAELYSNGGIDRWYDRITVEPDNTVESVSIHVHKRTGSELPAPPDWGLFASIPREWSYQTACQFVFTPNRVQSDDEKYVIPLNGLWDVSVYQRNIQNGCVNYNTADETLHRKGQYREPSDDDDDGEDDEDSATGYGKEQYRRPIDREDDKVENRGYGENNGDDDGSSRAGLNGDASENEDDGDESNEKGRFGEEENRPPIDSGDESEEGAQDSGGNDDGDESNEVRSGPNGNAGDGDDDGDESNEVRSGPNGNAGDGDDDGDESNEVRARPNGYAGDGDDDGDENNEVRAGPNGYAGEESKDESEDGTQDSVESDDQQNHRRLRAQQ